MKNNALCFFLLLLSTITYSQKQILWEDKFENNSNNWLVKDHEAYNAEINNGFYKLKHKKSTGGYDFYKASKLDPYMDYYIEIKVTLSEGSDNYGFGLYMDDDSRITGNDIENFFTISGNGYYRIYNYSSKTKENTYVVDWKETSSVKKGYNQSNILAVKKSGETTTFYVNGQKVHEQQGNYFWGENIGFILYNEMTIHVDHILVKQDRGHINLVEGEEADLIKENMGSSINTKYSEIMPVISPDGQTLYITVKDDPSNTGSGEKEKDDVWYSTKDQEGNWSTRKNIGSPINNSTHNFVISISPDNNSLILAGQYDKNNQYKSEGISISHRTKKGWDTPEDITITNYYNNAAFTAYCISPDRKVLIMAVERNDSYGYLDLYVSFLNKNKTWSEPKNMGKTINTYGYEVAPFIAADGKTLYYSTNGKLGYGSNDIFMSKRLDDSWTHWSEPKNLGPKVNTADWDAYYTIPASGDYAYMVSSDHSLGQEDIFRVKVSKTSKPEPVVIIYGKVLNKVTNAPIQADIIYHDLKSNEDNGIARSNPNDGSYKIILPYGKAYGFLAEKENFLSESDNIDLTEIKQFTQIERNLYLSPIEIGKSIRLNNVFFERSQSVLLHGSDGELNRLVKILKDNPKLNIEISGHTDNVGVPEMNVKLSEDRVNVIKKYLINNGISGKRLTGKGYGGSMPVASNESEETRKLNRRVEFKIISK
jgi:outer membrane protein OmpA-like peptidoglycan-associated protein